jgi:hypothetical protein
MKKSNGEDRGGGWRSGDDEVEEESKYTHATNLTTLVGAARMQDG